MTKRKYYNCPIKAAFMAKEFGVKFETLKGFKIEMDIDYNAIWWDYHTAKGDTEVYQAKCFYVTEESEKIFKPKHDDLGLTRKDLLPCVFNFKNNWMGLSIVGDYGIKEDEECFITMRDNKNFLSCEVEK